MQPHILVIVPAWNTANFLQATLQSVVEQTFREFEVIMVNDGSTDETYSIMQKLAA
jgi:glycosyltransferase involved in cell wall biosynthesis